MNLVAKEYVAAQNPEDPGVLILSPFAGAAYELHAAVIANPYDPDAVAEALQTALGMPLEERCERWRAMMAVLRRNSIAAWRESFLGALSRQHRMSFGRNVALVQQVATIPFVNKVAPVRR